MARFLVVDDSPTVRLMLRAAIKSATSEIVEIEEAEDGEGAMRTFRAIRPDMVFLDMVLAAGGSGGAILEAMLTENPEARVVLVTGLPGAHASVVEAISRGAFAFIQKPVRTEAVRKVLDTLRDESSGMGRIR